MKSTRPLTRLEKWSPWPFYEGSKAISTVYLNNDSTYDVGVRGGWHNMRTKYPLHPVIAKIIDKYRPDNWQQLLLEWPHISETDPSRLAYSRDERGLIEDRQVITTLGKYIKRHWSAMPDHMIRDYAAFAHGHIEIWDTSELIICAVELGPRSCMKSSFGNIPFLGSDNEDLVQWFTHDRSYHVNWGYHPYRVYDPKYGWAIAVRYNTDEPNTILGRCLVHQEHKCFVRSYARGQTESSYSETDHALEAWLKDRGYRHVSHWPNGVIMRHIHHPDPQDDDAEYEYSSFMAPYIDGEIRGVRVTRRDGELCLVLDRDSDWTCENTNGHASKELEPYEHCDHCDSRAHPDDMYWVGRDEDSRVCRRCFTNNFEEVRGDNGRGGYRRYYVHWDYVQPVYTDDRSEVLYYIDTEYVPDCAVYSGYHDTWFQRDDCIDYNGDWYPRNLCWIDGNGDEYPDHVEFILYEGDKWLKDDAWQCAGTGLWYPDHVDCVTDDDGKTYHPDYTQRVSRCAEEGDDKLIVLRTAFEEYITVHVPLPTDLIPATSMESIELAANLCL